MCQTRQPHALRLDLIDLRLIRHVAEAVTG
jgi:hypothetical protein